MTLCYRPRSPMLRQVNARQQEMIDEENKIHRIVPKSRAICQLASIDSPNCIWFRMVNHIAPQLRLDRSAPLEQLVRRSSDLPETYDYVMAPLEEGVYARARVVFVQAVRGFHFSCVHFIDEGFTAWMFTKCLAKMPSDLYWHPWQAFPVSLFKLEHAANFDFCQKISEWPELVKEKLLQIMGQYELFKVVPVEDKLRNNYSEYTRAHIYGLESEADYEDERKGEAESIAHRLQMELKSEVRVLERRMNKTVQQMLRRPAGIQEMSITEARRIYQEMPQWRRVFPTDFAPSTRIEPNNDGPAGGDNSLWVDEDGNEVQNQRVPSVDLKWLMAHCGGRRDRKNSQELVVTLCIDWNSLKSPHEFYAFPISQGTKNGIREDINGPNNASRNPIRRLFNLQTELALELDTFYGNPANRRCVNPVQIVEQLRRGPHHPFAIYETNSGMHGGNFRRVQVLAIRNLDAQNFNQEFVRVRYLDVGGSEMVPIVGLLQIHPSHCQKPPLCIQLCLELIRPPHMGTSWMQEEVRFFKSFIRVDAPAKCHLRLMNAENSQVTFNSAAQNWPGVFAASELVIGRANGSDDGVCVEQKMVDNGKGDWQQEENGGNALNGEIDDDDELGLGGL